jgi:hypothetical protein
MPQVLKDSNMSNEELQRDMISEGGPGMSVEEVYNIVKEDIRAIYAGDNEI